jgi:peptidoglycan hydrolase-like protein with peptidoglycan-binding domain
VARSGPGIVAAAVVVVAAAGIAAAVGFGGRGTGAPQHGAPSAGSAEVTRMTLVDYAQAGGDLGYGDAVPLRYTPPAPAPPAPPAGAASAGPAAPVADDGQHLVTWLPAVGAVVGRGQPLLRVDERPVLLLYGQLPLYRTLAVGVSGPDVLQLERNLAALGYTGLTVDEDFTGATASVVRRWQKDVRLPQTGTVAPGQVLYADGTIRVARYALRVGDAAGGEILDYTGTARMVSVPLPLDQQRYAAVGTAVTVTLPDGRAVAGTVAAVGQPQAAGGGGGPPAVPVTVTLPDQDALGSVQQGPVTVRFVTQERKDVLTVPVTALVALAEGGYGVQVVQGSSARYVPVQTGLFAGGRVEVSSAELSAGMRVVVPS